jgi:predicted MFS family arabinose efflux permease
VVSFLAGSSAPTPLYATYQRSWGFSPITTTIVFGVYGLAFLVGLLVLGRLSNHVGRKPVILVALAVQAVSMVVFATAGGVGQLILARVLQGVTTGAAVPAVGAAMLDISRTRGAIANSVAPNAGTAVGALVSAIAVRYLAAPTHLIYLALIAAFAAQAAGIALVPETVSRAPGAVGSLRPELALPRRLRPLIISAAPVLFAVWALAGFYASLGPALIAELIGSSSAVYGGLGLFVLAGTAGVSGLLLRDQNARTVMLIGIGSVMAGVAVSLASIAAHSPIGFFAGTAVAGVGFGSGFQGGVRLVVPVAAASERAGTLSTLYLVSYVGMSGPAVVAGVLVVHAGGLTTTAREYGIGVILLAALALTGLVRTRARPRMAPEPDDGLHNTGLLPLSESRSAWVMVPAADVTGTTIGD